MRHRALIAGAACAAAMLAAGAGHAQATDTASVDAKVKFVEAFSVSGVEDLDFGTATVPSSGPATITIAPAGSRSTDNGGGLVLINTAGNTGQPAGFSLSAEGGAPFSLSLSYINATAGYSLTDFRVSGCSVASETATTTTLPGTGVQVCGLNVGATLGVPSGATGVVDVGDLQLTIEYN